VAEVLNRELYLGTIEDGEPAKNDEDGQAVWRAHQSAGAIVNEFAIAERGVRGDPNLSDAGKQAALAALVASFETRIGNSAAVAERIAKRAAVAEASMTTAAIAAPATALAEQRAAEIRGYWRQSDREAQTKMLHAALDANDAEILSALLNAPRGLGLLTDQIRAHVLDTLASRNPQREQVTRLKRGSEVALFGLNRARKFLRERAGLTESAADRLRRVESGR
jgi:hypothetical protein